MPDLAPEVAERAVRSFLDSQEVLVERMTKKGLRTFDCRAAVVSMSSARSGTRDSCAILEVVLRHGTPAVRPDDVLAGLRALAALEAGSAPLHERLAQGPLDTQLGTVGDPLALHRDTA